MGIEWTFRSQTKMKVAAIIVLLAVAVYAKPPGPPKGGKGDGDMEQKAPDVVMSMVKLCMRLSEMADDDDKRSWDAVFGLYGQVCEGIKAALEEKIEEAEADDDKRSGPMPTGLPEFSGPKKSKGSKEGKKGPKRGSGDVDDDDKRSGPSPTGMPKSGDAKMSPEQALLKLCFDLAEMGRPWRLR